MRRVLFSIGFLFCAACGSGPPQTTLDNCLAVHDDAATARLLPACVDTTRGAMATDAEYIAGVVDCELGWLAKEPAALMAQAVAARTYLAAFLDRKGERAKVPVGAHFQCWRPAHHQRSREAAELTQGVVLYYDGRVINGNYVAGARTLDDRCHAQPPTRNGYRHTSWEGMMRDYQAARKRGRRRPFRGVYWTELLVTRNTGKAGESVVGTPMASPGPKNRGALGQYAANCLAELGHDTQAILRYFYGEDIAFSRLPPDAPQLFEAPMEGELPDLMIPVSYNAR